MPRSLVSFWKRVAVSGPTVDGRDILPQELRDIAETYSSALYTAVIWCEHDRWYGSHGTVFAVRLVENAPDLPAGQVALEAQLKPNDKLLWLNDQGEKLFTSIEITPNFPNTGKAYLTGLAVTDSPASLGTQELYFSSKTSKAAFFAEPVQLDGLREPEPKSELSKFMAMFAQVFKRFAADEPQADTPNDTPNESNPLMDEATGTGLKALRDQLLVIVAGLDAVIESAAAAAPEPDAALVESTEQAVNDIVETVETEREFNKRKALGNKGFTASLANIEKMLSDLQNAPQGRVLPRTTRVAPVKRVL